MNMFLLSNLSNKIIDSASCWAVVDEEVNKWSVVGWSLCPRSVDLIESRKKHVWGSDFASALGSKFILLF